MKQDSQFRSTLSEILKGYSFYKPDSIYIKHLGLDDYVDFETLYDEYYDRVRKKGVETEEELMDKALNSGLWSDKKDRELADFKDNMENAEATYEKSVLKDQRRYAKEIYEEFKKKYYLMLSEKESFVSNSCEKITERRMNEYYVIYSLYRDRNLQEPFLAKEDIEDTDTDFVKYIKIYNNSMNKFKMENIKKIASLPFFQDSWQLAENPYFYYGKPISQITYFQSHLANYGELFASIFKQYPNLTGEPDEIIQKAKFKKEVGDKHGGDTRTVVGMSPDEAKESGIQMPDRTKMFEEALKKKESG